MKTEIINYVANPRLSLLVSPGSTLLFALHKFYRMVNNRTLDLTHRGEELSEILHNLGYFGHLGLHASRTISYDAFDEIIIKLRNK